MSLRDRLLALLRDPAYSPGNEFELSRRLDLKRKDRGQLAHEVRALLKSGDFVRGPNGRIAPRVHGDRKPAAEQRRIFTPTRRGPSMPPPEMTDHSPVEEAPPAARKRSHPRREVKEAGPRASRKPKRETSLRHETPKATPRRRAST